MALTSTVSQVNTFSTIKKGILAFTMCMFLGSTFIFFNLPYSFLPLYNEDRNISTSWTGGILGASSLGLIAAEITVAPILLLKLPTRFLLAGSAAALGVFILLFSLLGLIANPTSFKFLALILRFIKGAFGGILNVTSFAALVAIYPNHIATATAVGECVLNGAVAFGPFLGGVLYASSGFIVASIVPGVLIFVSAFPALLIPNLNSRNDKAQGKDKKNWSSLLNPWILFPLWHLATGQILLSYHMPLLSVYVEHEFQADVVWAGTALLVSTAVICLFSPLLGLVVDYFGPYPMMIASTMVLPLVYMFIGPLPLFSSISPSRVQLLLALGFLGIAVPMACIPVLPTMHDVYRFRNKGKLPLWVANALVSVYCAAYPLGLFIGSTVSGFIAPYATFGWSTGSLALLYLVESVLCCSYCFVVIIAKRRRKSMQDNDNEGYVAENMAAVAISESRVTENKAAVAISNGCADSVAYVNDGLADKDSTTEDIELSKV